MDDLPFPGRGKPDNSLPALERLHVALRAAMVAGRVDVRTDFARLHHYGSPVYNVWDHLLPLLLLSTASMGLLLFFGIELGLIAMVMAVLFQLFGLRFVIESILHKRAVMMLRRNLRTFSIMWQWGGVTLVLHDLFDITCPAPRADWRAFTRLYVMAEKPGEEA